MRLNLNSREKKKIKGKCRKISTNMRESRANCLIFAIHAYICNSLCVFISSNLELSHFPLVPWFSLSGPDRWSQVTVVPSGQVHIQSIDTETIHVEVECDTLREITINGWTDQTGFIVFSTRSWCFNKYVISFFSYKRKMFFVLNLITFLMKILANNLLIVTLKQHVFINLHELRK